MFVETYGLLYQQNSKIFTDLFTQLRYYYTGRDIDLKDVMNSFFNELLQKMFELLNQVRVDDRYRQCLTNTMDELKPFADVPIKLSMHVKRALIAARTFVQGLAVGRDVITTIMEIAPSEACVQGIVRMTHCPYCRGLTATKPCHNFCMNTMKGCLANHAELNAAWNDYISKLQRPSPTSGSGSRSGS
ncbi:glypican [Plakobranchus ocellatus]|uniref:Glypican n=1 Tax=Plakobranchus ocellatus TaxID=259542 RepID=A0AAV4E134_9GAST|nr:glypican [Plakobranchus ocellatus]